MRINSGVADAATWERVAYKGDSEIGVINLTAWLSDKAGNQFCIVVTWNNSAALDRQKMLQIYASMIDVVRRRYSLYAKT